jgi:hypothetical protein
MGREVSDARRNRVQEEGENSTKATMEAEPLLIKGQENQIQARSPQGLVLHRHNLTLTVDGRTRR